MQGKRTSRDNVFDAALPTRISSLRRRASRPAPEERQAAILRAALDVFSENGFAATRLEDIARRAGVAKGTVYLYFSDKEALFERVLQSLAAPLLERLAQLAADEKTTPGQAIELLLAFFQTEILNTPREMVLRLIISEGPRFPALAKFYYDNVVSKGLASMRKIMGRPHANGGVKADVHARFPQLLFAPLLMTVVWRSLFSEFEPLDAAALLEAYKSILVQPEGEA